MLLCVRGGLEERLPGPISSPPAVTIIVQQRAALVQGRGPTTNDNTAVQHQKPSTLRYGFE